MKLSSGEHGNALSLTAFQTGIARDALISWLMTANPNEPLDKADEELRAIAAGTNPQPSESTIQNIKSETLIRLGQRLGEYSLGLKRVTEHLAIGTDYGELGETGQRSIVEAKNKANSAESMAYDLEAMRLLLENPFPNDPHELT